MTLVDWLNVALVVAGSVGLVSTLWLTTRVRSIVELITDAADLPWYARLGIQTWLPPLLAVISAAMLWLALRRRQWPRLRRRGLIFVALAIVIGPIIAVVELDFLLLETSSRRFSSMLGSREEDPSGSLRERIGTSPSSAQPPIGDPTPDDRDVAVCTQNPGDVPPDISALLVDIGSQIERVGATEFNVDRSALGTILEHKAELTQEVRTFVEVENGELVAIRLQGICPGSLFGLLGMEDGDRVRTLNGVSLVHPQMTSKLFKSLRATNRLTLSIERGGRRMNLEYNLR